MTHNDIRRIFVEIDFGLVVLVSAEVSWHFLHFFSIDCKHLIARTTGIRRPSVLCPPALSGTMCHLWTSSAISQ